MERLGERNRPGFRYHLKVHTFRALTVVFAWAAVVTAFYQKPELLTSAQRAVQRESKPSAMPFHRLGGPGWNFCFEKWVA